MELILQKIPTGFGLADAISRESWSKLKPGESYKAKITRGRNIKHHRKFFALLGVVLKNMPEDETRWPTTARLLTELKLQTGRCTLHISMGGKTVYIPDSIAFASMSQTDFEQFYDDCVRIIIKHVIPGIDESELREAATNELTGF